MNELEKDMPITNGDLIRSFSDDELAKLSNLCPNRASLVMPHYFDKIECPISLTCEECMRNWLKEKADD